MSWPTIDRAPFHFGFRVGVLVVAVDGVEAASRRRATVLRVLGERNRMFDSITFNNRKLLPTNNDDEIKTYEKRCSTFPFEQLQPRLVVRRIEIRHRIYEDLN